MSSLKRYIFYFLSVLFSVLCIYTCLILSYNGIEFVRKVFIQVLSPEIRYNFFDLNNKSFLFSFISVLALVECISITVFSEAKLKTIPLYILPLFLFSVIFGFGNILNGLFLKIMFVLISVLFFYSVFHLFSNHPEIE